MAGGSESIVRPYGPLVPALFVMVTSPDTAAAGTFTFIWVSDHTVTLAVSVESTVNPSEKVIKLVDALVEPNTVPVIVTNI